MHFLRKSASFNELQINSDWKEETITLFGKEYKQPRLTCWYGEYGVVANGGYQVLTKAVPFTSQLMVLKNKIEKGFTEDQIYKFLTKMYGEWILYDPQFNKNTYFLWFLPLLIFLFGGAIILKKTNKH